MPERLQAIVPADKQVAAVILKRPGNAKAETAPDDAQRWSEAIQQSFGKDTLLIILGENEQVEMLDEGEMMERGWIRSLANSPADQAVKQSAEKNIGLVPPPAISEKTAEGKA